MGKFWNGKGVEDVVKQIASKDYIGGILERFRDSEVEQLAKRNPNITNGEQFISPSGVEHLRISRIEKPTKNRNKSTPDQIGDVINSLSTSSRRRFVTAKEPYPAGVIVPHGEKTFFGAYSADHAGRPELWTAYDTKTEKLPKRLDSSKGTGVADVTPFNYASNADSFTQRHRLSAVSPNEDSIPTDTDKVKNLYPWMVGAGGGAGAMLYPYTANASSIPEEPGLESPSVDPVDILLAPIGVAGAGAKAASMAAEPFISYGMDKLGGLIGRIWGD